MSGIKKNMVWSTILTTANYIFPLIVYPYVSRVLGVTNLGTCNFVDSIINYYSLFAMMGINTVAIREISEAKTDQSNLSKTFSSLLTLNLITTSIMMLALISSIFLIPRFYENKELMFVGVFKLLFNTLVIEWFYRGLEDFRYITIRSILVRALYVISVFFFVRESSDYPIYYALTVMTVVLNGIINVFYSKKYIRFSFRGIRLRPFVGPFFILGLYAILTSMYTTFNTAYLGFICGDEQVGYYTTATKLHSIILSIFTAFTGVMLPRMSSLLAQNKRDEFTNYFNKSIEVIFCFAAPIICLCIPFADQIVRWISGPGYEQAIPCMQVIMPLIFVIGFDQIITIQILLPLKRDKDVLCISFVGAVVGILANILLVAKLQSLGSSIAWLSSEIIVLSIAQHFASKHTGLHFPFKKMLFYFLSSTPLLIILILIHKWNPIGLYTILLAGVITIAYSFIFETYINKNEIIVSLINQVMNIIKK